ncbi:MAG: hypothetical protein JNM72_28290 [Deltaproteobacteria bacterium]|nr:hypothetical protein [Deltaproteobacteria bacterium]
MDQGGEGSRGWAGLAARLLIGGGRRAAAVLPARVLRRAEDRLFYAIFHVTRVTNDAYGWRPPAPDRPPAEGTD